MNIKRLILILISLSMTFAIILLLTPQNLHDIYPGDYLTNELHSFKIHAGSLTASENRYTFDTKEDFSKLESFIDKIKVRKRFIFENPREMIDDKMVITIYMKDGTVNTITDHSIFWYNGPCSMRNKPFFFFNTGKYAFYKVKSEADIQSLFEELNIRR